jgi:hypothetical protein
MVATKPRHQLTNAQERIESTDQNVITALHHAALLALGAAVLQGDAAYYGVVQGGIVSASGASLAIAVSPILALRLGTAATSYDSAISWIQTTAVQSVDLTAYVDGANPRWLAIEVTDGYTADAQELRQFWNPATQAAYASLVDKVRTPTPVLSVRAGTAAAAPVFPAGGAGVIPLAYVYLAAGALVVQATDVVMCRPMLRGDVGGDQGASGRDVWGGGVSVATAGVATSLRNAGGRFANHRTRWGIQATDGTTAFTLGAPSCDGAALPVADDVLYFYACPAPYPSGYDSNLAPREHRPGATALTHYQGMAVADVYNAVIVASSVEPQADSPQGSPTAGNFTMTCAPFAAAATIDRTAAVYLGAGFYDFGTGFLAQAVLPGGETRWTQSATTSLPTEANVRNSNSTGPNTGDSWLANPLTGSGTQIVPSSASSTLLQIDHAGSSTLWRHSIIEPSGPTMLDVTTGPVSLQMHWLRTRTFGWTHEEGSATNSTLTLTVRGWMDGIIAQR